jgi:hypothetical protein
VLQMRPLSDTGFATKSRLCIGTFGHVLEKNHQEGAGLRLVLDENVIRIADDVVFRWPRHQTEALRQVPTSTRRTVVDHRLD